MSTEPRQIAVSGGAAVSMATLGESPVEEEQDQGIREDLITSTVNPTPPTMEEIQHSINGRRYVCVIHTIVIILLSYSVHICVCI